MGESLPPREGERIPRRTAPDFNELSDDVGVVKGIFEGGFLQLVRNERGIVFVHVENVVDPYREGIDVGDDFLKLVGGQAAFGEVVEFKRRVGVAARTLGGGRGDMRGGAGVVYYYW